MGRSRGMSFGSTSIVKWAVKRCCSNTAVRSRETRSPARSSSVIPSPRRMSGKRSAGKNSRRSACGWMDHAGWQLQLTRSHRQLTTIAMRFHAGLSEDESTPHAADELITAARQAIPDPDLAFVFFTAHHLAEADALLAKLSDGLDPGALIGCSGEGVIGPEREVERAPGIALLVAKLPGVNVHPFHIARGDWRDLLADSGVLN